MSYDPPTVSGMTSHAHHTTIDRLTAERDALRAALEDVCRCRYCGGTGKLYRFFKSAYTDCENCAGTGRDYHGSEAAKRLLAGGR